jgi:fido (protein-threonine AMPylation protein)/predicted transcriptional regulator
MAQKNINIKNTILEFLKVNPTSSSKQIHEGLGMPTGYATVKRMLQKLIGENLVLALGQGKATRYGLNSMYALLQPVDIEHYFKKEIDEREIKSGFDHSLISQVLNNATLFTASELQQLNKLQQQYVSNTNKLTPSEFKKELDRLAIDLSWKSSQIEGNTYSLLETEHLLKEKHTASGKTKEEASMLLNHKDALDFIIENTGYTTRLTVAFIEDIHSILIKELNVDRNIRKRRVGISGTNYMPLDNEFQIKEALEDMCSLINKQENVFAKALLALLLLSYIQAFADGNKRTARIISNAILISNKYCPISFRTVDSIDYKKALLLFYEQNNITAFKKIFMEQFEFAVKTYF